MARRLTLNDGTVLEGSMSSLLDECLSCIVVGDRTPSEVANLFLNPEKTESIHAELGDEDKIYRGYTKIKFIIFGEDISIGLRRPEGWREPEAGGN